MSKRVKSTIWFDRGFFPAHFGFCPNEEAWNESLKRMGVAPEPYPTQDARVSVWYTDKKTDVKKLCMLITISDKIDDLDDPTGVCALIVHECMHVTQFLMEDIGEHSPSHEFEAYTLHWVFTQAMEAYSLTRKWKDKKK